MSTVEIRADLIERIINMDERFLQAMYQLAVAYDSRDEDPIAGYDIYGEPKRASELMDKYEKGIAAVKKGDYITVEELAEKSKAWLSTTK